MELKKQTEMLIKRMKGFGVREWSTFLLVGICCLILVFPTKEKNTEKGEELPALETSLESKEKEAENYVDEMEERLEAFLSCVENVGEVRVMITAKSTAKKTVLKDGTLEEEHTTEQDSAGGSRVTEHSNRSGSTVFSEAGGSSQPYILEETYPEITGVVVIAEGSGSGTVDYDILNAVQVLFDVPAHKIKIMKMK